VYYLRWGAVGIPTHPVIGTRIPDPVPAHTSGRQAFAQIPSSDPSAPAVMFGGNKTSGDRIDENSDVGYKAGLSWRILRPISSYWRAGMDATRSRRIHDSARQSWYAHWRSVRFARHLGFSPTATVAPRLVILPLWRAGWPPGLLRAGATLRPCG